MFFVVIPHIGNIVTDERQSSSKANGVLKGFGIAYCHSMDPREVIMYPFIPDADFIVDDQELSLHVIRCDFFVVIERFGAMMFDPNEAGKAEEVVYTAIKTGYRLIDTAASYMNEDAVGRAIKRAIDEGVVKRKELFVVSKLWVQDMTSKEAAAKAIQTSLDNLGLEYIDLYLEHDMLERLQLDYLDCVYLHHPAGA